MNFFLEIFLSVVVVGSISRSSQWRIGRAQHWVHFWIWECSTSRSLSINKSMFFESMIYHRSNCLAIKAKNLTLQQASKANRTMFLQRWVKIIYSVFETEKHERCQCLEVQKPAECCILLSSHIDQRQRMSNNAALWADDACFGQPMKDHEALFGVSNLMQSAGKGWAFPFVFFLPGI